MTPEEQLVTNRVFAILFLLAGYEVAMRFLTGKKGHAVKLVRWMAGLVWKPISRLLSWLGEQTWEGFLFFLKLTWRYGKRLWNFGLAYTRRKGWIR